MKLVILMTTLLGLIACNNNTETNHHYSDSKNEKSVKASIISMGEIKFTEDFKLNAFTDIKSLVQIEDRNFDAISYCSLNYDYSNFERTVEATKPLKIKEVTLSKNRAGSYVVNYSTTQSNTIKISFSTNVNNIYSLICDFSDGAMFKNKDVLTTMTEYFKDHEFNFNNGSKVLGNYMKINSVLCDKYQTQSDSLSEICRSHRTKDSFYDQ